jgi:hypothetical protein
MDDAGAEVLIAIRVKIGTIGDVVILWGGSIRI